MRLFIAIELDDGMRSALRAAQAEFKRLGARGNYTPVENLHLTLAFIGEYPDPDRVLEAMAGVSFEPFQLSLSGLGAFGDLWWAGLERSDALSACVKRLRHALAEADIPFDRKRFSPHITLLRRAEYARPGLPAVAPPRAKMTVRRISLMRSDRGKGGMIYTTVGELSGAPDNSREQGTENREQE